jgi:hypothetical protein
MLNLSRSLILINTDRKAITMIIRLIIPKERLLATRHMHDRQDCEVAFVVPAPGEMVVFYLYLMLARQSLVGRAEMR